ncbi:MAG: 5'/3'-nucleotidase SurE [Candidatus Krumholzibacteria bacterium]
MLEYTMPLTLLLTNDDGYDAPGLQVLIDALEGLGDIYVVAPLNQQSASSHSLTLRKRIGTRRIGDKRYTVDGTPTDCVLVAVDALLEKRPDLVISGINHGPNMGEDVTYSGTVAAAIEGTILGIRSIALSSLQRTVESVQVIGPIARTIVETAINLGIPGRCFLNVNIPNPEISPIKGVQVTKLGSRAYDNLLQEERDEEGNPGYIIGGEDEPVWKDEEGTDIAAVRKGYVSITPLHLDLTHYKSILEMERWRFDL